MRRPEIEQVSLSFLKKKQDFFVEWLLLQIKCVEWVLYLKSLKAIFNQATYRDARINMSVSEPPDAVLIYFNSWILIVEFC